MPGEKGKERTAAQKGAATKAANKAAREKATKHREMLVDAVREGVREELNEWETIVEENIGISIPDLGEIPERLEEIKMSLDDLNRAGNGAQNGADGAKGDEMKDENVVSEDSWLPAPMAQPRRTAVTAAIGVAIGVIGTISFGWLFRGKSSSSEDVADIGGSDVELRIMEGGGL